MTTMTTMTNPHPRPLPFSKTKSSNNNNSINENENENHPTKRAKKKRRLDKNLGHVMVVGSGLAGLSVALSLEQAGYQNISLFERDINFESQKEGYGLTISYNLKGALSKLGLLEQTAQADCPSRSHYIFEPNGNILGYFGNAFLPHRGAGQRGNLRVPRKFLRRLLLNNLKTTKVYWNHKLIDYKIWDTTTTTTTTDAQIRLDHPNQDSEKPSNETPRSCIDNNSDTKIQVQFEVPCQNEHSGDNHDKDDDKSSTTTKTVMMKGDVLVAADGIRSTIVQRLYERRRKQPQRQENQASLVTSSSVSGCSSPNGDKAVEGTGLRPMQVRLILGISNFSHPLVEECGFYTLDGTHRLFTMPYESNRWASLASSYSPSSSSASAVSNSATTATTTATEENRVMWQLSFGIHKSQTPLTSTTMDSRALQECVLKKCQSWHDPIYAMIQATPLGTIWGTDLMDRDPKELLEVLADQRDPQHQTLASRIVVVGDALHAMSPFKGSGANQALQDGPLLASWLERASIDAAVKGFMREAVQRSAPIVQASHEVARKLHHPEETNGGGGGGGGGAVDMVVEQSFAGVHPDGTSAFLSTLRERHIGAALGGKLDDKIVTVIEELGVGTGEEESSSNGNTTNLQQDDMALECSRVGDTQGLRGLSLEKHARSIKRARDHLGRSCLHLAALGGHTSTCKWLLSEVGCDDEYLDQDGKTPLEYATANQHEETMALFHAWQSMKH